ncbi:MAG: hypothetical protein BYD32DRAFT_412254 [Podila humilis]|nr:MAG: hypothetical protein BYD32DRAFT_412254 [Podila humilis]
MADANARLQFLWKASHMLLAPCPQASSLYMSQFLSLASDRELRLHEDIQSRACSGCGSIFVPGMNSTVKIVPAETKQEREKRKASDRRNAKTEKKKATTSNEQETQVHEQGLGIALRKPAGETLSSNSKTSTSVAVSPSKARKATNNNKKKIRIIPYTEQMQKQNQQRGPGAKRVDKAEIRSNQLQNHVVYHCKRCERETEIPGTKKGYLESRIKPPKTISRKRTQKRQAPPSSTHTLSQSPSPCPPKDANTSSPTIAGQKRPRSGLSASMPVSPVGGLSRAVSSASSAATSPASSPRMPTLNEKSNSKKKKKTNLASLLASQKAQKDSSDQGGGGGGGGDSVLANFLMGL